MKASKIQIGQKVQGKNGQGVITKIITKSKKLTKTPAEPAGKKQAAIMEKFIVISKSEGTMSEIFYMTGKDWPANGANTEAPKFFDSQSEAEKFVSEFNGGENDLYVEAVTPED